MGARMGARPGRAARRRRRVRPRPVLGAKGRGRRGYLVLSYHDYLGQKRAFR